MSKGKNPKIKNITKDNSEPENEENKLLNYYDYDTIKDVPEITWIVQDVIPNNGLIIVYGSPGSGKTFIVLDVCLHIINEMEWFNNKINNTGVIVYLIGEGIYGIKKRLDSWGTYHNIDTKNLIFFVPISSINIWEEKNINRLKTTLNKFINNTGQKVIMIIVDTLARAATGLDENSSRDMGMFLRNFEMIKEEFECSILFIHHKGKDESRGMRGSSSLLGAADTCIDIQKTEDNGVVIKIEKQKDGENKAFNSRLLKVDQSLVLCTNDEMINNKNGSTLEYFSSNNIMTGEIKEKVKWTKEDDNLILRNIKKGKSVMEISEIINVPNDRILNRFRRLITKQKNKNKSMDELVYIYGIKDNNIISYLSSKKNKIKSKTSTSNED